MSRPTAKPAIKKAPARVHPVAPKTSTPAAVAKKAKSATKVMHSVRIRSELRRELKRYAIDADLTLEELTETALEEYLANRRQ